MADMLKCHFNPVFANTLKRFLKEYDEHLPSHVAFRISQSCLRLDPLLAHFQGQFLQLLFQMDIFLQNFREMRIRKGTWLVCLVIIENA